MSANSFIRLAQTYQTFIRKVPICMQVRYVEKGTKPPAREEPVDKITMPGFVTPDSANEEGYFTQKAKQQLEELKKKMDKPKVENIEKKD